MTTTLNTSDGKIEINKNLDKKEKDLLMLDMEHNKPPREPITVKDLKRNLKELGYTIKKVEKA